MTDVNLAWVLLLLVGVYTAVVMGRGPE